MRIPFSHLFEINLNGSVSLKYEVHFDDQILKPGHSLKLRQWLELKTPLQLGKDIEVEQKGLTTVVMGFYP